MTKARSPRDRKAWGPIADVAFYAGVALQTLEPDERMEVLQKIKSKLADAIIDTECEIHEIERKL